MASPPLICLSDLFNSSIKCVCSAIAGLKTKYTNLSEEVKVAVGDIVSTGTEIGTVGNTSGIFTSKVCGDVLNIQVQDANGNDVDPGAYFDFK